MHNDYGSSQVAFLVPSVTSWGEVDSAGQYSEPCRKNCGPRRFSVNNSRQVKGPGSGCLRGERMEIGSCDFKAVEDGQWDFGE